MKAEDLYLLRTEPGGNLYLVSRARTKPIQVEFDALAEHLQNRFRSKRLLELGCDSGLLIASLRQRGVEAYGIDQSSAALEKAQAEIQPFLRASAYNAPFQDAYDLIVCIQALSGLDTLEVEQIIENICRSAPAVFFCQAPLHPLSEDQPEPLTTADWARLFASCNFYHDLEDELEEFSPWCVTFRRGEKTAAQVIEDYERRLTRLRQEVRQRRSHGVETHLTLTRQEAHFEATLAELQSRSEQALSTAQERSEALQHELDEVYTSHTWRFALALRRLRLFFVPLGSRRERWLLSILGK